MQWADCPAGFVLSPAPRGIGAAISRAFVNEGGRVVVTDVDEASGAATADALGISFVKLDAASEAEWQEVARKIPQIDVPVNGASITGLEATRNGKLPTRDPEHASLGDWRAVHATHLDGTSMGCRYAISAMRGKTEG